MSTTGVSSSDASGSASVKNVDMKLEVVVIPVSDVDRAKEFYGRLGWRLDADFPLRQRLRRRPVHAARLGVLGPVRHEVTSAAPGSAQGIYLIVSDIEAARDELAAHGVEVSEVFHPGTPGAQFHVRRHGRSRQRRRAGSRQLQLLRHVQRPGRQRLAAAGDHHPAARPSRRRRDGVRIHGGPGERAAARGGRPRRAREAHRSRQTRTGPTGTPRTWWRSRPGRSCPT